jgi:Fic family protein
VNKEIKLLIKICGSNKFEFSVDELASFLNLKFIEGIYPYIRKLQGQGLITKQDKGIYSVNIDSEKVKTILFLQDIYNKYTEDILSIHTKKILEKFSKNPILKSTGLPYHNLKHVKDIAKKTKLIHITKEGNTDIYFIRSWEEPVRKVLSFFEIKLDFDEEEYKHYIIKAYSAFTGNQTHLKTEKEIELAKLNMQYYLEKKDFILDKLKNTEHPELKVIDIITENKLKGFRNPFEITKKINDWKIKYVYNTDKIEGNALTFEEVKTALTIGTEGIRREKKDILETINSQTALSSIFDTTNELDIEFIKKLHKIVQQGIDPIAGEFKKNDNCIVDDAGTLIDTTTPAKFTEERMQELFEWYSKNKDKYHPIALASIIHNQFLYVHPFDDGNGRVARLIFNFVVIKKGYFPIIFFNDEKQRYYSSLRQAKDGDMKQFIMYCAEIYRIQQEYF